mmetsp:Transcript_12903/g.12890  ORF Transcript_12903/g.12890 Transcript_12903/m.12890 type:complete len:195 (-) Transcript_12903:16-600(-)
MDPSERQDCKSLLTHKYFDDFTEIMEEEVERLLELDNNEFKMERIRRFSNERDGSSYFSPSPTFQRTKQCDPEGKDYQNEAKPHALSRKDGTPSFNKMNEKNKNLAAQQPRGMGGISPRYPPSQNDEFNMSFTNENYNPMKQVKATLAKNESSKVNSHHEGIIINTKEQPNISKDNQMITRRLQINENYNNDTK